MKPTETGLTKPADQNIIGKDFQGKTEFSHVRS